MPSLLFGCRYIGNTDPVDQYGPIPFGFQWADTGTRILYERDNTGTSWVEVGDLGAPNYNLFPAAGGPIQGPITGPSGLASTSGADFLNLTLNGLAVTTQNYVDQQIKALKLSINTAVTAALLGQATVNSLGSNVARATGLLGPTDQSTYKTIPVPKYADGTPADPAECVAITSIGAINGIPDVTGDSALLDLRLEVDPTNPLSWKCYAYHRKSGGGGDAYIPGYFNYTVLAFRSS